MGVEQGITQCFLVNVMILSGTMLAYKVSGVRLMAEKVHWPTASNMAHHQLSGHIFGYNVSHPLAVCGLPGGQSSGLFCIL